MENVLIRHGVFETNSSSTHSISIVKDDVLLDTLPVNDQGNVFLTGGEFGCEWESYYAANDKANYMLVYAIDWAGDKSEEFITILKQTIKDQTQCNEVVFDFPVETRWDGKEVLDYGYIDHQAVEDADWHYLFEDPELLRLFIFNSNSFLKTGNDNSYDPDIPVDELINLASSDAPYERIRAADNKKTPVNLLEQLAEDEDEDVLVSLASNPSLPKHLFKILAGHSKAYIRQTVAENPETPIDVLQVLTGDPNRMVSYHAKSTLEDQELDNEESNQL